MTAQLHDRAVTREGGEQMRFIGAVDLATMMADFVLDCLSEEPGCCANTCQLDDVTDDEILEATGFSRELLAAAFIGAAVELAPWCGEEGLAFMLINGVPEDDAAAIAEGAETVCERLGSRGRTLLDQAMPRAVLSPQWQEQS